jgi:hypothetical protein
MIGDASRHRGCARDLARASHAANIQRHPQTFLIGAEIVNRSDQIDAHFERSGLLQEPHGAHRRLNLRRAPNDVLPEEDGGDSRSRQEQESALVQDRRVDLFARAANSNKGPQYSTFFFDK